MPEETYQVQAGTAKVQEALQNIKKGNGDIETNISQIWSSPKEVKQLVVDKLFSSRSLEEPSPIGMTGNQSKNDIKYLGFTTKMKANDLLNLASDRKLSSYEEQSRATSFAKNVLTEVVNGNKPRIAPPFLKIDWDTAKNVIKITGHEGRHRSSMINRIFGNMDIPVDINNIRKDGQSLRRKGLTNDILDVKIINQDGKETGKTFRDLLPDNLKDKGIQ